MVNYTKRSLEGLWIGDCIGNLGQLYFVHDVLKALEAGIQQYGSQLNQFQQQFVYSDDTEEAIVLYNHLLTNKSIDQDKLAMEFATRYMDRDPDGEIYGYGLSTRKVLRNIYDGMPWNEANKMVIIKEGTHSSVDKLVMGLTDGKGFHDTLKGVQEDIAKQKAATPVKEGSCGNGSAMRVAPLGAWMAENELVTPHNLVHFATKQSQPTHCHEEGIAGSIAITTATAFLVQLHRADELGVNKHTLLPSIYEVTPPSVVRDGIGRALKLDLDTPITEAIKVLGNGTHVTCQDTVPLCCWLVQKYLRDYPIKQDDIYENAIIETSMAFGDVDTNCAIVGGMIGTICLPPEKWVNFCKPMEGVVV